MKTVSRFDRDGSGRRRRLGTEKMAGVVAFGFSVFHCDEVLIFIFEWLHRAFRFSVFEPGLLGSALLLAADTLAKTAASTELPVSIFTSLLGVPFLLYLILRPGRDAS